MDKPQSASEVRSLLGMASYCGSRFIQRYATLTQPLRELTRKDVPWKWTDRHDQTLVALQDALVHAPVLKYLNSHYDTQLYVDASTVGLGAPLMQVDPADPQTHHVVAYASRALSQVQQRYSQTERESLAVIWAYNPADYISRHPYKAQVKTSREEKIAEEYINYITATSTPKAITIEEIELATEEDETLKAVMQVTKSGKWYRGHTNPLVNSQFYTHCEKVKHELAVCGNGKLVLRGHRIVIPEMLQDRAVRIGHEGHMDIAKTKALLREKIWFPRLDKAVEHVVKSCIQC
ncbi:uncharacterized protein LOC117112336 [Anneissia japonica]|uniref:uncharacterized protein LOC117112336 n=1 Tax=Anneissia japonica TaxID=1529436 RepID=UPI00142599A1|nr:uncharacterized protein LOC117112336 [Anneissia japonica]